MSKNMKSILAGVAIFIVGLLVIRCYSADLKVKKSEKEIAVLNNLVKEKDAAIDKLTGEMQSKQQEIDTVKKELDNVKTELSNTVLRLQASTPAPAKAPVKK